MTTELLTPRETAFVVEYIQSNNAKAAYLIAAQAHAKRQPNEKTAEREGHRWLQKPKISQAIQQKTAALAVRDEYSQDLYRADLRRRVELAEAAGNFSAVFKGMELQGRHYGWLNDSRVGGKEAEMYAWLGAAMERERARLEAPSAPVIEARIVDSDDSDD